MATILRKETKNSIHVDYEGKLSFKERLKEKVKASNTWITGTVNVFRFILMLGVSYVILFPFIARIAGSFMSMEDVVDSTISLIPKHPTLNIYRSIIAENHYWEALSNTLILSLLSAIIQTFVACLVGYGLAKFKFKGNKLIMGMVVVTMVIPHATLQRAMFTYFGNFDFFGIFKLLAGGGINIGDFQITNEFFEGINLAPHKVDRYGRIIYETIWTNTGLNLNNSYWPLVIMSVTGLGFKNGLYIFLLRQFFMGVPDELEESAYIDGSGVFRTFFTVIIPLSVPMLITVFLFAFSWQWTDNFYTDLFFTNTKIILINKIVGNAPPKSLITDYEGQSLYYAAIRNTCGLMIIAPLVIMYAFFQKYLVQGIERSGLTAD